MTEPTKDFSEVVINLSRDLVKASITLGQDEARFLVDAYYMMQDQRIRSNNQVRTLTESEEPHAVLQWLAVNSQILENNVKRALDKYSMSSEVGLWSRDQLGIGPVIAAGLMAHIDMSKAPTVGHIWNFAGLNPNRKWNKGEKRPWNASLKVLCWKIGESFMKVSGRDNAFYGQRYKERKERELANNEAGLFAEQAERALSEKNYGKTTESYKAYIQGRLPPAQILRRAQRWTTKLFLSHWHYVAYYDIYGEAPPKPYAIEHTGHAHFIAPPGWPR